MSAFIRTARMQRWAEPAALISTVIVISGLHYLASTQHILVHEILKRLYYVPIVIAAIGYGAQGGLAISLLSSALYLPHIMLAWSNWPVFEAGQYGEIVLFNVVGAVTGVMADRLRSERNRYRLANEELKTAYEQLETSADERVKAERMATVGRVAAGMAHEIRTPLSAILGCFEILGSDYPDDHPKREFLEILKKEIARAETVVATFLDFAQPASPRFQSVDLNGLARSVGQLITATLAERSAPPLIVQLCSRSVPITVDAHQTQRALIELVLAGAALSPGGSVTLRTATHDSTASISLMVEPVDQGLPGDLFEPFNDGRVARGLTLPLVKRLVEHQGGTIKAARHNRHLEFVIEVPTSTMGAEPAA